MQVYLQETAVTRTNDQGLTNLYGSVVCHIQHRLVLFSGPLKPHQSMLNMKYNTPI